MVSERVGCSQPWIRQVGLDAAEPVAFLRHSCISVRRGCAVTSSSGRRLRCNKAGRRSPSRYNKVRRGWSSGETGVGRARLAAVDAGFGAPLGGEAAHGLIDCIVKAEQVA